MLVRLQKLDLEIVKDIQQLHEQQQQQQQQQQNNEK